MATTVLLLSVSAIRIAIAVIMERIKTDEVVQLM
jgi:hypothetical protein